MAKISIKGFKYPQTKKIAARLQNYLFEQELGELRAFDDEEKFYLEKALRILLRKALERE